MLNVVLITLKGIFRDRVFHGILMTALVFLLIPSISALSMRQVTELSITLSLSLISFILLLLAVFLGGTSLWKDIDRRYTFSILGLPLTRGEYLMGKFFGSAFFLVFASLILGAAAFLVVYLASSVYPSERPIIWVNIAFCILFDALKYALLIAFAFLFSTVSTSFFLPIFGTIAMFLVGNATQQVFEYVNSAAGKNLSLIVKQCAIGLYYILPNFSAFNLKINAIYGLPLSTEGLILTAGYFAVYTAIILTISVIVFSRREMR